ncbi:amidohydrolase family protein [Arthrobacter sp. SA17]
MPRGAFSTSPKSVFPKWTSTESTWKSFPELPGIQAEKDPSTAVAKTKTVNDFLAGVMAERPTRFSGFAALPLQDPQAAARELERAVTDLGMKGALVNAHTNGMYLDDPKLRVVWEMAEGLDVPLYLHPANGVDTADVLSGHPELVGPMWSWGSTPQRTPSG